MILPLKTLIIGLGQAAILTSWLRSAPVDVSADLARFTADGKIPGMVVLAVKNGETIATGASGVRKSGDATAVKIEDKFHIGSCTKSMTGTLAAIIVRDGKISWKSTLADIFPDMKMHPDYKSATLLQLCSNSGGVPGDVPPELWAKTGENREKPEARQRMDFVRAILAAPPAYPPGSKHVYSNGGFTIAGAMLEKVTGKSYNELLRSRLFKPLDMASAGFGMPATRGKPDHPWGHVTREGKTVPIAPGPDSDNPPAITPAGRVHLSILDFAKYANFHLRTGDAGKAVLHPEALDFLHTAVAPGNDYALGWVTTDRPWGNGPVVMHNGSNTMNYCVIWLAPKRGFAVMALCNSGDESAGKACDEAVGMLIGRFLK